MNQPPQLAACISERRCSHLPMPVQGFFCRVTWRWIGGMTVPWDMLLPHDEQAKKNHCGQDLQRLYERHGMGASEVLAVLEDRPWKGMDDLAANDELARRIADFNANPVADRTRHLVPGTVKPVVGGPNDL